MDPTAFLPVSREDMHSRDWWYYDFLVVTADAYVDHPSFGTAIIARCLEAAGYRTAVLAQPDWHSAEAFRAMGRPRYGVFIGGGNIDSMVAHYTAAKKRRSSDAYSPGGKMGLRPDRPTIVYANRAREAFPDTPVVIGGLEASLRRFAHYDYWDDKVRRSILFDAQADLLVYGMGERATREIADRLARGEPAERLTDIRGTCWALGGGPDKLADSAGRGREFPFEAVEIPSFEAVCAGRRDYALATKIEYEEHDPIRGRAILQRHGDRTLVVNPPAMPLSRAELDAVAELPYAREVHPMYDSQGGVAAIEEVRFSVTHNRGCFGGCNFCSLAFHQGRMVTSRSHESVVREVEGFTRDPKFKGYVHDVGGPSANFRHPSCQQQLKNGMCKNRSCLAPTPCKNLDPSHADYLALLRKVRSIPGVKKVFIRSGIRYDYMLCEQNSEFFSELVKHHISGQLKVAPEHCADRVLDCMGKPHFHVYEKFRDKYQRLNQRYGLEQYLVPYLMSSHPGCTLSDAVELAVFLNRTGRQPEQVQDFYPTPGTLSTCMWYTELDPRTMEPVYVARSPHDKALQRSLLQWKRPEMRRLVVEALHRAGREDLIGYGKECLVRPLGAGSAQGSRRPGEARRSPSGQKSKNGQRPEDGRKKPGDARTRSAAGPRSGRASRSGKSRPGTGGAAGKKPRG